MRALRLSLVGTVTLALLSGPGATVLAQSEDEGNSAFTLTMVEQLDWYDGPTESQGGFNGTTMGGSSIMESSDPRLSGTWTEFFNCRQNLDPFLMVCTGNVTVENEGGTWFGRVEGAGAFEPGFLADWTVLEGQGDYAGLTAIRHIDEEKMEAMPDVDAMGVIFDFGVPPQPEAVAPPAE